MIKSMILFLVLIAGCTPNIQPRLGIPSAKKGDIVIHRDNKELTLEENGVQWMADSDWETETQAEAIEMAHGIVWTFGLGLGIFAEDVAAKGNVTKIVVIEINKDIIDLVWPYLDLKGKGKIIKADAWKWIKTARGPVDFIYADIWTGGEKDFQEQRARMKELCKRFNCEIICWNQ